MESGGQSDIGPFATEIFEQNLHELQARAPGIAALLEADRIAVIRAISKASWQGTLRGIVLLVYDVNAKADAEQVADPDASVTRIDSQLRTDEAPDPWADKYGD